MFCAANKFEMSWELMTVGIGCWPAGTLRVTSQPTFRCRWWKWSLSLKTRVYWVSTTGNSAEYVPLMSLLATSTSSGPYVNWLLCVFVLRIFSSYIHYIRLDTGIRGLMRGMANLPQGNQELLVVKDKVGRPPGEFGVSKSMGSDIFPSVLRYCWLGDRKGIRPVKQWV